MELEYITVSRLLLVPVAKKLRIGFSFIRINLGCSIVSCCFVYSISLRTIIRKWFVTTVLNLPTHILQLQPHRISYGFSVMIQKQFYAYFNSLPQRSNISVRKALERIRKSYAFSENAFKHRHTIRPVLAGTVPV